jgi:ABC-2 type transport system permease protein
MLKILKNVFSQKNKALLSEMVRTDFKLRYQNSILGYLWSLLKPLLLFAILYTVFTQFLRIGRGIPNYPISLLLGLVLWNFFTEATSGALRSIVSKGGLIRKINIPRYLIPVASIASAFINMLLNLVVVFIFVLFANDTPLSLMSVIIFPLLLLQLVVFVTAIGFFLAAAYVKFRDIEHIWEVAKQALFYTAPIIYPLSLIPSEMIQKVLLLNPLAQIIQDSRAVITYGGTEQIWDLYSNPLFMMVPFVIVGLTLFISTAYFRKNSKYFAEEL